MPGLTLTTSGKNSDFTPPPADVHVGICVAVIDLGTHPKSFQGKEVMQHKVRLAFELPFCKMEDGRPFVVMDKWTASLEAKSKLRPLLESWRGQPWPKGPISGFSLKDLLGKPAMITVTHADREDGGKWVNIKGIAKLGKNPETGQPISVPAPFNPLRFLELTKENYDANVMAALGEKTQELIKSTPEWKALNAPATGTRETNAPEDGPKVEWPSEDSDLPF